MAEGAVVQKIAQLTELLNRPDREEESVFCMLYDIFKSSLGGTLQAETVQWLNETVSAFLSPQLRSALEKLCLDVYSFKFSDAFHFNNIH